MAAKFVNRQAMEELKVKLPLFGGVQQSMGSGESTQESTQGKRRWWKQNR